MEAETWKNGTAEQVAAGPHKMGDFDADAKEPLYSLQASSEARNICGGLGLTEANVDFGWASVPVLVGWCCWHGWREGLGQAESQTPTGMSKAGIFRSTVPTEIDPQAIVGRLKFQ
ncbi:hypothetical protein OGAPHI_004029 [Ogataea philodendri]|uniref:Uncharacterized protein n=1 Tax=Ogataea philodendri TaxID=1378263 RepID=A0A9P8T5F1_9ASCO|nr:uncharacterized protein OGAPHI_004029 [Ogataea philodendri]KAH3665841.1 hypothetical protein OGAPHI_004029 [Ogataea philodendri]